MAVGVVQRARNYRPADAAVHDAGGTVGKRNKAPGVGDRPARGKSHEDHFAVTVIVETPVRAVGQDNGHNLPDWLLRQITVLDFRDPRLIEGGLQGNVGITRFDRLRTAVGSIVGRQQGGNNGTAARAPTVIRRDGPSHEGRRRPA